MKNLKRLLVAGAALTLAVLSCQTPGPDVLPTLTPIPPTAAPTGPEETPRSTPPPDEREIRQNLIRSTVQIVALDRNDAGQLQPVWSGSGAILSPDGLILTNYHVAIGYIPDYRPDAVGIAITVHSDEPPEPSYLAEVRAADYNLDLAVIQITSDLDGRAVDAARLNLSYTPLGDSDLLELGDALQILGYPGIGGETITYTEGSVSGFTRERGVQGRAWIKTDATIAGGNSGGLAADMNGHIIGVPTEVGFGGADRDQFTDCRYLADTNGDGVIDENDSCIPVGGFINALRPINLAKPLVEAARTGTGTVPGPGPVPPPSGEARFYNLAFASAVTEDDRPAEVVTELPSGTTDLYALWDYEGMADGVSWEARWYRDGQYLEDVSWPSGPWQGGEEGSWWLGITNADGLTDGTYRIELYVGGDDEPLLEGSIPVGGAATGPTFTGLRFSADPEDRQPANPRRLPAGVETVYAFFDYAGMRDGLVLKQVWHREGEEIGSDSDAWDGGESGTAWVYLSGDGPFPPGAYRLELFVDDKRVAAANFTIASLDDDLYIQGYILDADTAEGIPGASFVVLEPGLRIEDWNGSEAQIYTSAETDANGYFELPIPLERGESYSMLVVAEGYRSTGGDDNEIGNQPSPLELEITLQRE